LSNGKKSERIIDCQKILNFQVNENEIVICTDSTLIIINENSNKCGNYPVGFNSSYIAYSFQTSLLAYQKKDFGSGSYIVQNTENTKEATKQFLNVHNSDISMLSISQNGKLVASCSKFVNNIGYN
jgi:hypothetical protein